MQGLRAPEALKPSSAQHSVKWRGQERPPISEGLRGRPGSGDRSARRTRRALFPPLDGALASESRASSSGFPAPGSAGRRCPPEAARESAALLQQKRESGPRRAGSSPPSPHSGERGAAKMPREEELRGCLMTPLAVAACLLLSLFTRGELPGRQPEWAGDILSCRGGGGAPGRDGGTVRKRRGIAAAAAGLPSARPSGNRMRRALLPPSSKFVGGMGRRSGCPGSGGSGLLAPSGQRRLLSPVRLSPRHPFRGATLL